MATKIKIINNETQNTLVFVNMADRMASNYVNGKTMRLLEGRGAEIPIPGHNSHDLPRDHISLTTTEGRVLGYLWQRDGKVYSNAGCVLKGAKEVSKLVGGEVVLTIEESGGFVLAKYTES